MSMGQARAELEARFGSGPDMTPRAPSNFVASAPKPYDQIRGELESRNAPKATGGQDFSHLLNVDHIREDFVTQDEAQKQVLELVANAVHHDDVEINPEDAIVEGFTDGIKLLPHQIVGRKFMAERESGKGKLGGILADDMGCVMTIRMDYAADWITVWARPSRLSHGSWITSLHVKTGRSGPAPPCEYSRLFSQTQISHVLIALSVLPVWSRSGRTRSSRRLWDSRCSNTKAWAAHVMPRSSTTIMSS